MHLKTQNDKPKGHNPHRLRIVTFLSAVCLRRGLFLRLLVVSSAESCVGFGAGYFAAVAVRHGLNILVGELVAGPDDIGYGVAYRREHNIDEPQNGLRVVCLSDTLEVCEVLRSLNRDPAGGLETEYEHSERAGDGSRPQASSNERAVAVMTVGVLYLIAYTLKMKKA